MKTMIKNSMKTAAMSILAVTAFSITGGHASHFGLVPAAQAQQTPRQPNWVLVDSWAQQLQNDTTWARATAEQERDTGGFHQIGVRDLQDLEQSANLFYQNLQGNQDAAKARQDFAQVVNAYSRADRTVSRRDFGDQVVVRVEECSRLISSIQGELSNGFTR